MTEIIDDGHTVTATIPKGYMAVKLEINCPHSENDTEALCGGGKVCMVRDTVDDIGAECIEIDEDVTISGTEMPIVWYWLNEDEIWVKFK